MRLQARAACLALFCALGLAGLGAEEAAAYLEASSLFGQAPVAVARLDMLIARKGSEISRVVELSLDRSGPGAKTLARIISPAFLSGMKFLKIAMPGEPEAQWLKTSRGIRRLGAANRSEPVFDSDFTAEDFGTISSEGFELSFSPARDGSGWRAIEARPRGAAPYALRVLYIDPSTRLLMGMDYLDSGGAALKRYRVTSVTGSGPASRPAEALMEDLRTGGSTRLRITSFETPASLPARLFNSASL